MRKKGIIISLCLICIIAFIAAFLLFIPKVIYQSDGIKVTQIRASKDRAYTSYEWAAMTDERAFQAHPVIVSGAVTNVQEVEVTYLLKGETKTDYFTLFDFEIAEYLKNTSSISSTRDVLRIGYAISSRNYAEGVPLLEDGKKFILFCQVPADMTLEDPKHKEKYVDCWIYSPYHLMLEEVDGEYIVSDCFAEYLSDNQKIKASAAERKDIASVLSARTEELSGEYEHLISTRYVVDCNTMTAIIKEAVRIHNTEGN